MFYAGLDYGNICVGSKAEDTDAQGLSISPHMTHLNKRYHKHQQRKDLDRNIALLFHIIKLKFYSLTGESTR